MSEGVSRRTKVRFDNEERRAERMQRFTEWAAALGCAPGRVTVEAAKWALGQDYAPRLLPPALKNRRGGQ
jgi:hypothetical protein